MERRRLITIAAGEADLRLVAEAAGSAWEVTPGASPANADAAVVFGDAPELIADLLRARPSLRVVAVLPELDRAALVRAMRAGAGDVLAAPIVPAELAAALSAGGRDDKRGRSWAVLGATGGSGATTLAVNLADVFARGGVSAALIDLDVEQGQVAQFLDVKPRFTLADVVRNPARLDATYLNGTLHALPTSLRILAAPLRIEEAEEVTPERVRQALDALRAAYGAVVLDLPRSLGERTLEALDRCDEILLLVALEVPALAAAKRLRELFARLGYPAAKTRLLAARAGRKGDLRIGDAQRVLGAPFLHTLPDDPAAARAAMNLGKPLSRSALLSSIEELAAKLAPQPAKRARRGLFEKLHAREA